jgi:hypothetical protein
MLSEFFESRARIHALRDCRDCALFEGFAQALSETGYATITARRHLRAAEHFIYWTRRNSLPAQNLNSQLLAPFELHLNRCRCRHFGHANEEDAIRGVRVFLGYLQGVRVITRYPVKSPAHDPVLLAEFLQWIHRQRGTCDATLYNCSNHIRDLLGRVGEESRRFDAHRLRAFVLEKSRTSGWAAAKTCTTTLRMFVRFMVAVGHCAAGLEGPFPHWLIGVWRLCHDTSSRKEWNESSHRAIRVHPLVGAIGRFCSCWSGWAFGQAILCTFA